MTKIIFVPLSFKNMQKGIGFIVHAKGGSVRINRTTRFSTLHQRNYFRIMRAIVSFTKVTFGINDEKNVEKTPLQLHISQMIILSIIICF